MVPSVDLATEGQFKDDTVLPVVSRVPSDSPSTQNLLDSGSSALGIERNLLVDGHSNPSLGLQHLDSNTSGVLSSGPLTLQSNSSNTTVSSTHPQEPTKGAEPHVSGTNHVNADVDMEDPDDRPLTSSGGSLRVCIVGRILVIH